MKQDTNLISTLNFDSKQQSWLSIKTTLFERPSGGGLQLGNNVLATITASKRSRNSFSNR